MDEGSFKPGDTVRTGEPDGLKRLRDPYYLPTHEDVLEAFYKSYNLDESKGYTGGELKDRRAWTDFCKEGEIREDETDVGSPVYELWNKEYIEKFGEYLAGRIEALGGSEEDPVVMLEVGAGNGRLTHFLNQVLDSTTAKGKFKLIAMDFQSGHLRQPFPVEIAPLEESLNKHRPRIVICSWMSYRYDLSPMFRKLPTVEEYILIGDPEVTGEMWDTYGVSPIDEPKEAPRYAKEGFSRELLDDLSSLQIARTDDFPALHKYSRSQSYSFRRNG